MSVRVPRYRLSSFPSLEDSSLVGDELELARFGTSLDEILFMVIAYGPAYLSRVLSTSHCRTPPDASLMLERCMHSVGMGYRRAGSVIWRLGIGRGSRIIVHIGCGGWIST